MDSLFEQIINLNTELLSPDKALPFHFHSKLCNGNICRLFQDYYTFKTNKIPCLRIIEGPARHSSQQTVTIDKLHIFYISCPLITYLPYKLGILLLAGLFWTARLINATHSSTGTIISCGQ
jgi:hypothetical protein